MENAVALLGTAAIVGLTCFEVDVVDVVAIEGCIDVAVDVGVGVGVGVGVSIAVGGGVDICVATFLDNANAIGRIRKISMSVTR